MEQAGIPVAAILGVVCYVFFYKALKNLYIHMISKKMPLEL